jgi:hypothetical protein
MGAYIKAMKMTRQTNSAVDLLPYYKEKASRKQIPSS